MPARAAVILAAGQGTRMKSPMPKVLHKVGGRAMLDCAIDAAEAAGAERIVVVVGKDAAEVEAHVAARLGPGHDRRPGSAARHRPRGAGGQGRAGRVRRRGAGRLRRRSGAEHRRDRAAVRPARGRAPIMAVLGFETPEPAAYGRLIMGEGDQLLRIVEAREATAAELAVTACNSGVFAAPAKPLFELAGQGRRRRTPRANTT